MNVLYNSNYGLIVPFLCELFTALNLTKVFSCIKNQ